MRRLSLGELQAVRAKAVDPATIGVAAEIVARVRDEGESALRDYAIRFGEIGPDEELFASKDQLQEAYEKLDLGDREILDRVAARIRVFAEGQRACLADFAMPTECGQAGHEVVPVETTGCYAPGGRYPLPSSMLMTAVTARAAGVSTVWAASPKPTTITLAAAHVAGVDGVLKAGGAQAIAALAYGCGPIPPCDAVVGPGNRYVTAAKQLVAGQVAIDMLAGPSELVVFADESADPATVAADMLAQAEHDPDASSYLVTASAELIDSVERELDRQMRELPGIAWGTLTAVLVADIDEGIEACNRLAPEHLELVGIDPTPRLRHYGALFSGHAAAEVFGDYGAGPNHTLPTGGTARSSGGLSVFTFLRIRTWMRGDTVTEQLLDDTIRLARWEGLEAHARAAERRISS